MDSLSKTIQKILDQIIDKGLDQKTMKSIAEDTKKDIQLRTRLGRGVQKTGDRTTKLEKLSNKYKKQRKNLRKKGRLSGKTTPAKSNLTKSGSMVDSLKTDARANTFLIKVTGRKNRIKLLENAKEGRSFLVLSKKNIKDIVEAMFDKIRGLSRKF